MSMAKHSIVHSNTFIAAVIISLLFGLLFTGCATSSSAKLPEPPPKYIYQEEKAENFATANSLWNDNMNIFEDRKARRLNDIVTINVVESLSGSQTADTTTSRDSSADFQLEEMLGLNTTPSIKQSPWGGRLFNPSVKGSATSDFTGAGDTNREGSLVARLTARIVEVMPNGNLILAGRKELTINDEKQVLVLTGMVRPDDISAENVVLSSSLADAKVYYVGDGVIQDKQKPGWAVRAFDKIWPF